MPFVPFREASNIGDRFLALLSQHGINPPIGSGLEGELLSITELIEVAKNPNLVRGDAATQVLRVAAGIHDLAAKVLSTEPLPDFQEFLPHLRLISQTKVRVASLGQNSKSEHDDDTARKIAELYVGCIAAHIGTNVQLDSPTNPKGDNPDVLVTLNEQGGLNRTRRWALAIKTISTRRGQTIFDRIAEGARQIDDPKCKADVGMVVINTKSALLHDVLWEAKFPNEQAAIAALDDQVQDLIDSAEVDRDQLDWDNLFKGKVVRPVAFLAQALVKLPTPAGAETPTQLKLFKTYNAGGSPDPAGESLAGVMHGFMQTILRGIPGGNGYDPQ